MDDSPILRDAFNWATYGIFAGIEYEAEEEELDLPWDGGDATILDLAYFGNHSGGKFCSPIVNLFLKTPAFVGEDGKLTDDGVNALALILLKKYRKNWAALWATNEVSYNPIYNYDMTESRSLKTANSDAVSSGGTNSDEVTHGKTVDDTTYKYGINTNPEDPKPSDKDEYREGGTTETSRTYNDSKNRVGAGEEAEDTRRFGNIGVTTTQQMLTAEREVWKWNFFNQIFSDVDKELTLMLHDPCRAMP